MIVALVGRSVRELPSHSRTSDVRLTFSDALTGIFSANLDILNQVQNGWIA